MNIRKIAELAGFAPSTVSRVLSGNYGSVRIGEESRQKILDICRKHNYAPDINARRLFSGRTGVVGLLTPEGMGMDSIILSRFINSVYSALNNYSSRLLLLVGDKKFFDERQHLSIFERREVDALIIWGHHKKYAPLIKEIFNDSSIPALLSVSRCGGTQCVYADDAKGIAELVMHCRQKGASNFVYIDGPEDSDAAERRRQGFKAAIGNCKYKVCPGDYSVESGVDALDAVLSSNADAVVCVNDLAALGLMKSLLKKGVRISEDIFLTGAGDFGFAEHLSPSLTTFSAREDLQGSVCVDSLMKFINDGAPLETHAVEPQLIYRASTGDGVL